MNTQISNTNRSAFRTPHSAFTLVELLIVLTVIGILVGLLIPAINGAMGTARELAIRTEMVQIEQAIESFKTEYGFYPPSFEQFDRSAATAGPAGLSHPGLSAFLRYLNRVAPNHQEASGAFPSAPGIPRAVGWWNRVGRYLDQQGSLVFWLSGLCKSKQFPLTGGADFPIPAFNASQYSSPVAGNTDFTIGGSLTLPDGSPFEVERDVRFEFQAGQQAFALAQKAQFVNLMQRDVQYDNNNSSLYELSDLPSDAASGVAMVAGYQQANGPSNGDKLIRYRDAGSYALPGTSYAYLKDIPGYANGRLPTGGPTDALIPEDFINPNSFQLISLGMDGEAGLPFAPDTTVEAERRENAFVFSTEPNFVLRGYDNMTNFSGGRLELYVIENE